MRQVTFEATFEGWRKAARECLEAEMQPSEILWVEEGSDQGSLALGVTKAQPISHAVKVPRDFLYVAKSVSLHKASERWALLYSLLWRLTHGEEALLENALDAEVVKLRHYDKEVSKDAYRMTAFVRFREVNTGAEPWFVAWYEPEHDTLECNADFFVGRFANMRWSILTPKKCMHWDGRAIAFTPGVTRASAPTEDAIEPLWLTYYASIFNPARTKPKAMQAQLLKRNWKNLPEAALIEPLLRAAPRRAGFMLETSANHAAQENTHALATPPAGGNLGELRAAAAACRACPLWRDASCTVFGEGPGKARVMLIGEQPGDQEDRAGRPFVGPAGQVLASALAEAGIRREDLYVTNAVKHFKWEPRGKRRIHQTPNSRDIASCRPWLIAEISAVSPELLVCLGATALRAIFETALAVTENRGSLLQTSFGIPALVTVHPSSLLRMPDVVQRAADYKRFVDDLRKIRG